MIFLQKHSVFASYSNYLGASRGFAFVEFNTTEEAAQWMEYTQVSTTQLKEQKNKRNKKYKSYKMNE